MTKIEKDSLIQKIENLEPDWQTGKYCESNCTYSPRLGDKELCT